jgi:LysM repeat protein
LTKHYRNIYYFQWMTRTAIAVSSSTAKKQYTSAGIFTHLKRMARLRQYIPHCAIGVIVLASCSFAQWSEADKDAVSYKTTDDRPSAYVVKKGDTLWDLAFKFLGDPFKWTELWHCNAYIKNPDLIYPGNSIVLPGDARGAAEPVQPLSSDSPAMGNDSLTSSTEPGHSEISTGKSGKADSGIDDSLFAIAAANKDYFTSDAVERAGFLWFGKDSKGLIYPGNAVIEKPAADGLLQKYNKDIYRQFDEIPIATFGDNLYAVGDTVDVLHSDRFLRFKEKTGNLIRRTGRGRIIAVSGRQCSALLFSVWDLIAEGDRIDTMAHFASKEIDTLVDGDVVIRGTVFERIEETEQPYLFHTFLCDRGATDGVRFGDLFAVYPRENTDGPKRPNALGCVINVGERTSTLCVEKLYDTSLSAEDTLELVKRIRFK